MGNKKTIITNAEIKNFIQDLEKKIGESNQVFITTHLNPDLDAIGSTLGMSLIANKFKKKNYIIMDDKIDTINSGVLSIIDATSNDFQVINSEIYNEIKTTNDILIVTDTNKVNMICCEPYLEQFKNIVIIDHHNQDSKTIKTINKFIYPQSSSTCELVTALLESLKINYGSNIANYLLAGIVLDTNGLRSETVSPHTLEIASKLVGNDADINYANTLLDETYETSMQVNELIKETDFYSYTIAICCGKNETIVPQEVIAKAANKLKDFKPDISCAIGKTAENTISICARSKGKIDVSEVMKLFGGGGDKYRGAAKIEGNDTEEVKNKLVKILKPNFYISEKELKNE